MSPHLAAARRMVEALNRAADALADARLDDLLAAERQLSSAVASWPGGSASKPANAGELRDETLRLRAALGRCRRLGLVVEGLAGSALQRCGLGHGYGRNGVPRAVAAAPALEARA